MRISFKWIAAAIVFIGLVYASLVFDVFRGSDSQQEAAPPDDAIASSTASTTAACHRNGCSGEICSDEDVVSACIYKPEFACYRAATCARQADGACGWTETAKLASCISAARAKGGGVPPQAR